MYGEQDTITIKIPYPSKEATVRLPTEPEAEAYQDALNKAKSDEARREAHAELFKAIQLEATEPFDEDECEYAIDRLLSLSIVGCDKAGDEYTVTIHTPFGLTVHTMRPPTIRQMTRFKTTSGDMKGNRRASIELYDGLLIGNDGYAEKTAVPFFHKQHVAARIRIAHEEIDPIQIDPKNV